MQRGAGHALRHHQICLPSARDAGLQCGQRGKLAVDRHLLRHARAQGPDLNPDLGNWSYTYDAAGNVKLQTDGQNQSILFDYDALNRVTVKHPCKTTPTTLATCEAEGTSPQDVTMTYDDPAVPYAKGRLTRMSDSSGTSTFAYDILGRQLSKTQTIAGATSPPRSPSTARGGRSR